MESGIDSRNGTATSTPRLGARVANARHSAPQRSGLASLEQALEPDAPLDARPAHPPRAAACDCASREQAARLLQHVAARPRRAQPLLAHAQRRVLALQLGHVAEQQLEYAATRTISSSRRAPRSR